MLKLEVEELCQAINLFTLSYLFIFILRLCVCRFVVHLSAVNLECNKCIRDNTKAAARQSLNWIKNKKK